MHSTESVLSASVREFDVARIVSVPPKAGQADESESSHRRFGGQSKKHNRHNRNLNTGAGNDSVVNAFRENLWTTAVELAKQHGVWPTATALHLDHSRLKGRVGMVRNK